MIGVHIKAFIIRKAFEVRTAGVSLHYFTQTSSRYISPAIPRVYFSFDKLLPTQTVQPVHRLNDDVNDTGMSIMSPETRDETLAHNYYPSNMSSVALPTTVGNLYQSGSGWPTDYRKYQPREGIGT